MKKASLFISLVLCFLIISTNCFAAWRWANPSTSFGQIILVPATHVDFSYVKDSVTIDQRAVTVVTVRNANLDKTITLKSVNFYDPEGVFIIDLLGSPQTINPLASMRFSTTDLAVPLYPARGNRPTILIEWEAGKKVVPPNVNSNHSIIRSDGDGYVFLGVTETAPQIIKERVR